MSENMHSWDDIPSLKGLEVDWSFESENPMGQRAYSRLPLEDLRQLFKKKNFPVKLITEKDQITAYLVDLSQGGIRLKVSKKEVGDSQLVKLGFVLGEQTIISRGRIKHIQQEDNYTILGIEFVGLNGDNLEYISHLHSAINFSGRNV